MLILNPQRVRFAGALWNDVNAVVIDRAAVRVVEDYGQDGPLPILVDVPQLRITVRVTQVLTVEDLAGPGCGDEGLLEIWCAPNASDAGRTKVAALVVVTAVRHDIQRRGNSAGGGPAATRTITMLAYTQNGKNDPVALSLAEMGID
jgi:hypothetical protein